MSFIFHICITKSTNEFLFIALLLISFVFIFLFGGVGEIEKGNFLIYLQFLIC
jgi:hypothetical protein